MLAYGIGLASTTTINNPGYVMPHQLVYAAWYLSAPVGSAYFSLDGTAEIGASAGVILIGYFFAQGYRAAYWASICLLVLAIILSIWAFSTFGFVYAVPANLAWIWFLRRDRKTRNLYRDRQVHDASS